jgi:Flp pilus assembly protein TadG
MRRTLLNRSPRSDRRRGSSLVESALVLFVFLSMLIAIMDFAQFLFLHQTITERTRLAGRQAVVKKYTIDQIKNYVAYGNPNGMGDANLKGFFGMKPSNVNVTISDTGEVDQRLNIVVSGLKFLILTPTIPGQGTIMPIRVSAPLELP